MSSPSHMTFAELGIPFPLFAAPVAEASKYDGLGTCELCNTAESHCFRIGIGDAVTHPCASCGDVVGHHVADRAAVPCPSCSAVAPWPAGLGGRIRVCCACVRAGRGLMGKDTEFGLLSWEQRVAGVTLGVPGLGEHRQDYPGVELVQTGDPEMQLGEMMDAWFGAKLPAAAMDELLRTPTYSTWQGETWLFEGPTPMIYLGCWQASNFDAHAEDGNGERLFLEAVQDADEGTWDDLADGSISVYVFRSPTSGRLRGTWDRD